MKERPFDITLDGRFCIRLCIDWHKTGGLYPLYDIILSAYMEITCSMAGSANLFRDTDTFRHFWEGLRMSDFCCIFARYL